MNVYKFIDISDFPPDFTPLIVIASHGDGRKIRAVLNPGFIAKLKEVSMAERMRIIKELSSVIEKSVILSLAEDKAVPQ